MLDNEQVRVVLQVAKGIGIASRALDRSQLQHSSAASLGRMLRSALLASLRIACRGLFAVAGRPRIIAWRSLRRRLLSLCRRWPVAVGALLRRSWRAAREARYSVAVEHSVALQSCQALVQTAF